MKKLMMLFITGSISAHAGVDIQFKVSVLEKLENIKTSSKGIGTYAEGNLKDGRVILDCNAKSNNHPGKISIYNGMGRLEGYTLNIMYECTNLIACLKDHGGTFGVALQVDENNPEGWMSVTEYPKDCLKGLDGM